MSASCYVVISYAGLYGCSYAETEYMLFFVLEAVREQKRLRGRVLRGARGVRELASDEVASAAVWRTHGKMQQRSEGGIVFTERSLDWIRLAMMAVMACLD